MAKQIKFNIKLAIDGKEQLVTATTNTKDLNKALNGAEGSAKKFSRTLMDLTNKGELFEQGITALKDMSDKLNEYNRGAMRAANLTGLHGAELRQLRSEAQAVADTYGNDIGEVLTSVSQLMKAFGVDASEAMTLIRNGLMSGADATGQFFDILAEYPAYFREAGMSAEQFMAVVTNGAQMGVFSDKAADTIKEGNLRLREMTTATQDALNGIGLNSAQIEAELQSGMTTTFQVMQQVGAKLKELPQTSAAVGTAIADIFGGPGEDAGLAYIESLSDMELSMDALKNEASDVGKSLDEQVGALSAVNNGMLAVVDSCNALSGLQPFLGITSQIGMTVVGIGSMVSALKALNLVSAATAIRAALTGAAIKVAAASVTRFNTSTRAANAMSLLFTGSLGRSSAVIRVFTGAVNSSAYAATAAKMAWRGLLIATGIGVAVAALTAAVSALSGAFDKSADSARKSSDGMDEFGERMSEIQQTYDSTLKQTYGDLMGKYSKLQQGWKALSAEHEKIQWIKDNQGAFEELGLSIHSVSDAEGVLNDGTDNVVKAFTRRAQAAAYAAKLTELYAEQLRLTDQQKQLQPQIDAGKNDKRFADTGMSANDVTPTFVRGKDGKLKSVSSVNKAADILQKQQDELSKSIADVESNLKSLGSTSLVTGGGSKSGGSTSTGGTGSTRSTGTTEAPAVKGSLDWYDAQISELRKKLRATADEGVAAQYQKDIEQLEDEAKALKVRIGVEKPEEAEVDTWLESLRKQLQDKQKQLEANLDVPSRLKVLSEIDALQQQINEATEGKVSITAPIEPTYTVLGSDDDKRRSYQNAQSRANRVQSDLEMGVITDKGEAQRQLDEIDKMLEGIGLKPLKINLDSEDATEKAKKAAEELKSAFNSLGSIDLSSFESVQSGLATLKDLFDKKSGIGGDASNVEKGFAAAGAAASALGNAMQKLGSDSEAAKAGLIAAALGQLALSFATAMASAGKDSWIAWLAFGLSGLATLMTIMQTVGAFANGGIVGGSSKSGDKLLARVNSGEMILNSEQQARLWKIVNGQNYLPQGRSYTPDWNAMRDAVGSAETAIRVTVDGGWQGKKFVVGTKNVERIYGKTMR